VPAFEFVRLIVVLLTASCAVAAAPVRLELPIADKRIREAALRGAFPGAEIRDISARSSAPTATVTDIAFPDAMSGEAVYAVVGPALDEAEKCAAEDVTTEEGGRTRLVTWKTFHWPGDDSAMLLVAQYEFVDARPSLACPSVAVTVRLEKAGNTWVAVDRHVFEMMHHGSIQRVSLLDLAGTGSNYLLVESDFGGAEALLSSLELFDLSRGRLDEVLRTESRAVYLSSDLFTRTIDDEATRATRGAKFCTINTTLKEDGQGFRPPRISRECVPRGSGVNR
jgi:hypothetical protein